ncbi:tyrosyl-tRNA deacylase [Saccharophagus degradans]|uniref:tyrosyl-tRNA deacylase n=1 Tax=Saccharophagus degradans TaxID=86304 RepID=UPI002478158C|nr:tyrosyl-tRNA deacylase [Saccharophagus degradans]WGO98058.1 tyrosyl-tRNA deacylase [Saccharophagus degradans]
MNNIERFESLEQKLNVSINSELEKICNQAPISLPKATDTISQHYITKLKGRYDIERSKKDTDNAIELLYIAYNTTPQSNGSIRVKISEIMSALIKAQQKSEVTMSKALRIADYIQKQISDFFPDWLDIKEDNEAAEIKDFVTKDMRELATIIRDKATEVQNDLLGISSNYETIIDETKSASNSSEEALSTKLKDKAAIEKEINEANARREQLESLVDDLQERVAKFEKMARDYESRAETAEERAFVMSIVQAGAQIVSAALPAVAMAAGGPGSFLAASTMSSINQTGNVPAATGDSTSSSTTDNASNEAQLRSQISEIEARKKAADTKKNEILLKISDLEQQKAALIEADKSTKQPATSADDAEDSEKPESDDEAQATTATATATDETVSSNPEIKAIEARIASARKELELATDNADQIGAALAGLNQSLNQLSETMGKMSQTQQDQASSLREMQMKMLDKVEEYENEKRNQTAELIKIKALLKGNRSEEETIQLAIKSLNLSLSALKRAKEIIQEIAFFFKSFADFMSQISTEASQQVESIDKTAEKTTLRRNRLAQVITTADHFFVNQTAEWHAVTAVSDKFCQNFADGWTKLNRLNGTYITGDELSAYLIEASAKLEQIADERQQASDAKVAYINQARSELAAS